MSYPSGSIPFSGIVGVTASTDTYPTTTDELNLGGYRSVASTTARDAIPTQRRKFGMMVGVTNGTGSGATVDKYILTDIAGTNNLALNGTNWVALSSIPPAGTNVLYPNGSTALDVSTNYKATLKDQYGSFGFDNTGNLIFKESPSVGVTYGPAIILQPSTALPANIVNNGFRNLILGNAGDNFGTSLNTGQLLAYGNQILLLGQAFGGTATGGTDSRVENYGFNSIVLGGTYAPNSVVSNGADATNTIIIAGAFGGSVLNDGSQSLIIGSANGGGTVQNSGASNLIIGDANNNALINATVTDSFVMGSADGAGSKIESTNSSTLIFGSVASGAKITSAATSDGAGSLVHGSATLSGTIQSLNNGTHAHGVVIGSYLLSAEGLGSHAGGVAQNGNLISGGKGSFAHGIDVQAIGDTGASMGELVYNPQARTFAYGYNFSANAASAFQLGWGSVLFSFQPGGAATTGYEMLVSGQSIFNANINVSGSDGAMVLNTTLNSTSSYNELNSIRINGSYVDSYGGAYKSAIYFDGASLGADVSLKNTWCGSDASRYSTASSTDNTAFGHRAAYSINSGSNNTAVGTDALYSTGAGARNTVVGNAACYNSLQTDVVAIGYRANYSGGAAFQSTFIGAQTSPNAGSQSNQIAIGYGVVGNGSDTTTIGQTSQRAFYSGGTLNVSNWTFAPTINVPTYGQCLRVNPTTINDIFNSGTVAYYAINGFAQSTVSASNVTNYTNLITNYIAGPPVAGGNGTTSKTWAHYGVGDHYIGGILAINTETTVSNSRLYIQDGHISTKRTGTISVAANTAAGTGAAPASAHTTDVSGNLSITTGTGPTTGAYVTLTFALPYSAATTPVVVLTASNSAAARAQVYVVATASNFNVSFAVAGTAATTYSWNYHVLESAN